MELQENELSMQASLQPELREKLWWKNEESEQILNRGYLLKGETVEEEPTKDEKPLLSVETHISDEYVDDTNLKIEIHKKINEINSKESLESVKKELEDRFGQLDESIIIYMYEELFEKEVKKLNIKNKNQTKNFIDITLSKDLTKVLDGENFFLDMLSLSRKIRFSMKNDELKITLDTINLNKHFIYYLLDIIKIINDNKKDLT